MSYDARMEKLPVLISYPRSGSNWFNSTMELYFNRPRLRISPSSLLPNIKKRNDFMWFHDHDINSNLKLKHNNIIYLKRNPSDVIFSLLSAEGSRIDNHNIDHNIKLLTKHHKKYSNSKVILNYELLKSNPLDEFKKFILYFDNKFDANKLNSCLNKTTKEAIIKNNKSNPYFTTKLLSNEYKEQKNTFKQKYEKYIHEMI